MRCNYNCSYCVNWKIPCEERDTEYWVKGFNKIETDLPITIGGGEPSLHEGFIDIINNVPQKVDILTNLSFDVDYFIKNVRLDKFDDTKTFAPIRISFHPNMMKIKDTVLLKVKLLMDAGFRVGVYAIECEQCKDVINFLKTQTWLDFQTKPLLSNIMGTYPPLEPIQCRIKELLFGPDGRVYRCYHDVYKQENPIGTMEFVESVEFKFRECIHSDECHPCDIKIKRDRFGIPGYCAIERKK
jgi:MoaA/NifB/PqqE/SkfB family radical SAM enzyme